jgi:2-keto-4-pentenoate hydratase/2-oxohepta-3-ene-1,7-dioic acid hydratase in catechol pathway
MKLVTYRRDVESAARLGVIDGDMVVDAAAILPGLPPSMLGLIDAGPAGLAALRREMDDLGGAWPLGAALPLAGVTLLAPIPRPRANVYGIGLNYVDHVAESARSLDTSKDLPSQPVIFSKPPNSVIGPGDPIRHDGRLTRQLDWEVELAAIIGIRASRVIRADALRHVFGYSVMIDISARDNRRAGQWIYSKGMDSYAPFGPCIVTADEIPDPQVLDLWLTVNGVEKQRSNTRYMLFDVAYLIADISTGITLDPGDIIATGTPEGVGAGRSPQEWLRPGDTVVACVEGIGTIRHPVIDASAG